MGKFILAFVLLGVSALVDSFSWYAPLWFFGVAPLDFINGCRLAALGLVLYAVIAASPLKVRA